MKRLTLFFVFIVSGVFAQGNNIHRFVVGGSVGGNTTIFWRAYDSNLNYYDDAGYGGSYHIEGFYNFNDVNIGIGISSEQFYSSFGYQNSALRVGGGTQYIKAYIQPEYYFVKNSFYDFGMLLNVGVFKLDDFSDFLVSGRVFASGGFKTIFKITETTGIYFSPVYEMKFFEINKNNIQFNTIVATTELQLGVVYSIY